MWNTFTTADPSVSSAAAFIPLNSGEWMHVPLFLSSLYYFSVFARIVCRQGEIAESVLVVLYTVQPFTRSLYTWATSATVYKTNVTFDTFSAPPYPHGVKLFHSLPGAGLYSHDIRHLPTPDITIAWVVELNDLWHKPEEVTIKSLTTVLEREGITEMGIFHTLIQPQSGPSIHPSHRSLESVFVSVCGRVCLYVWWIILPAATWKAIV